MVIRLATIANGMGDETTHQGRHMLFLNALDAYHDEPEYYEGLNEVRKKDFAKAAEAIVKYLRDWGNVSRNLPAARRKAIESALANWLREHSHELDELRAERIWRADFERIGERLTELFDSMKYVGKGFGPTSRGKTLHILLPDLCVVWDDEYVREPQSFDDDGKGYLSYLKTRQAVLLDAIQDTKRAKGLADDEAAVEWLRERHNERHTRCRAPITKLLDELNYHDSAAFRVYLESVLGR